MKNKIGLLFFLFFLQTGNAQWTNITSPYAGNLWCIKFIDQNNGFIGGNTAILKTTDGGNTWTSTSTSNFLIYSFSFPTSTVGYYSASNNIVAKTTNGGSSWVNQNPNASPYELLAVDFPTESIGYAVGDAGVIRKTTNGGTTWTTQSSGLTTELEEMHFFDVNTGICVGKGGKIKRTTNGGTTWSTISSGTTANLYDIYFVDNNIGYIAGATGTVLKTTNGGASWTLLTTGATNWLYCICFKNALEGYAGGAQGSLFKTTDGGATWQVQVSGISTAKDLNDIVYINNRYIAVTSQGQIITDTPNLGINPNEIENTPLIVFPNPASNTFSVAYSDQDNLPVTVKIIDINGALVKSELVDKNEKVNVEDLSNGTYIVEFKTDRSSVRKKLVIKK